MHFSTPNQRFQKLPRFAREGAHPPPAPSPFGDPPLLQPPLSLNSASASVIGSLTLLIPPTRYISQHFFRELTNICAVVTLMEKVGFNSTSSFQSEAANFCLQPRISARHGVWNAKLYGTPNWSKLFLPHRNDHDYRIDPLRSSDRLSS